MQGGEDGLCITDPSLLLAVAVSCSRNLSLLGHTDGVSCGGLIKASFNGKEKGAGPSLAQIKLRLTTWSAQGCSCGPAVKLLLV